MKSLTDSELREKATTYDQIHNEGGEGYNPYTQEIEKREWEESQKQAARPKSKKEQIDALHDRIRRECGSVARQWDEEEVDKKKAELYAEIHRLEAELEKEFLATWDLETTKTRRAEWNDFIRSIMDTNGRLTPDGSRAIYKKQHDQGWMMDDLKKAVKLHKLA